MHTKKSLDCTKAPSDSTHQSYIFLLCHEPHLRAAQLLEWCLYKSLCAVATLDIDVCCLCLLACFVGKMLEVVVIFFCTKSSSEKLRCLYERLCAVAAFDIVFCCLCSLACFVSACISCFEVILYEITICGPDTPDPNIHNHRNHDRNLSRVSTHFP